MNNLKKETISIVFYYRVISSTLLFIFTFLLNTFRLNLFEFSLIIDQIYLIFLFLIILNYVYSFIQLNAIKKEISLFNKLFLVSWIPFYLIFLIIFNYFYYSYFDNVFPIFLISFILLILLIFLDNFLLKKEINNENYLKMKEINFYGYFIKEEKEENKKYNLLLFLSSTFLNIPLFLALSFLLKYMVSRNISFLICFIVFLLIWLIIIYGFYIYLIKKRYLKITYFITFFIFTVILYLIFPILIYYASSLDYFYKIFNDNGSCLITLFLIFIIINLIEIFAYPFDQYFLNYIKKR